MRLDILLLLSFLAVIIGLIACSPPPNPTPTLPPTLFPNVTLTVYNPQILSTLTPNSMPSATIIAPIPEFVQVNISPPLCYPVNSQQISCLGYIDNQSETAIENVTINAKSVSTDGVPNDYIFTLEQQVVLSETVAPYRLQIPNRQVETDYLEMEVISAQPTQRELLPLQLVNSQGTYQLEDNQYLFIAELENTTALIATNIRLVITLENEDNEILGYRVVALDEDLDSGERIPIRLSINPLEATSNIWHRITLEAFAKETSPTPEG